MTFKYNEHHKSTLENASEGKERLSQLTKERDDLLALVMQRGKIIEVKTIFNSLLDKSSLKAIVYHR